ncbi:MAG: methylated-DNA--[protein]-cysteine S-methyltransferase [Acholeplasma sp.]|nr:methylated-DNA--[protein]-cysteine S-methyltransferase [Acholeplasma sp.]
MKYTRINVKDNYYYIGFDEQGITFVGSPNGDKTEIDKWFSNNEFVAANEDVLVLTKELLYFFNKEKNMIDVKIHMIGTEFQIKVWKELMKIPYGKTVTYQEVAIKLGDKNKTRAVATAVAKNPLLIIVPCHRVIGSDGALRGYRGGIDFKHELLLLEEKEIKNGTSNIKD